MISIDYPAALTVIAPYPAFCVAAVPAVPAWQDALDIVSKCGWFGVLYLSALSGRGEDTGINEL